MNDIGHNQPPADADPLLDRLKDNHHLLAGNAEKLAAQAIGFLDVECEEDAKVVAEIIADITKHRKAIETTRVAEKEPYLTGQRKVDGFFKNLTDRLDAAKRDVQRKLDTYLSAKAAEERRRREEEAARAKAEAERIAREAAERAAAMQTDADLREAIADAAAASHAGALAAIAEKKALAKPADLARGRSDAGALYTLQKFWTFAPDSLDRDKIDLNALRHHLPLPAIEAAIRAFIKAGGRELAGVTIYEAEESRVRR